MSDTERTDFLTEDETRKLDRAAKYETDWEPLPKGEDDAVRPVP